MNLLNKAKAIVDVNLVLMALGEHDLQPLLSDIPSPVYEPQADLIYDALTTRGMHTRILPSSDKLLIELTLKNVYILTSNIVDLRTGGTIGELLQAHKIFARDLAS